MVIHKEIWKPGYSSSLSVIWCYVYNRFDVLKQEENVATIDDDVEPGYTIMLHGIEGSQIWYASIMEIHGMDITFNTAKILVLPGCVGSPLEVMVHASWSIVVEEGEPVDVAGSGATTSTIGEMTLGAGQSTLDRGLSNSSNIG
ncbi:hypothetical protein Tco_0972187 [Tanacetum coccineum]